MNVQGHTNRMINGIDEVVDVIANEASLGCPTNRKGHGVVRSDTPKSLVIGIERFDGYWKGTACRKSGGEILRSC